MKKIGLIGEDPNDTIAIQNLLQNQHSNGLQFKQLIKNIRGHQLDNERTFHSLKIEYTDYQPHLVLFIRDADGIATENKKIKKVVDWFNNLNKTVENKGLLLVNIYELEALILADIATFNKLYGTLIKFPGNVMYQTEPKEFLIQKTFKNRKRYSEAHCPDIFKHLNFDTVINNCKYFKSFYENFKAVAKLQ
jgi:hypothetical protein